MLLPSRLFPEACAVPLQGIAPGVVAGGTPGDCVTPASFVPEADSMMLAWLGRATRGLPRRLFRVRRLPIHEMAPGVEGGGGGGIPAVAASELSKVDSFVS